jgi:hypothetical protein
MKNIIKNQYFWPVAFVLCFVGLAIVSLQANSINQKLSDQKQANQILKTEKDILKQKVDDFAKQSAPTKTVDQQNAEVLAKVKALVDVPNEVPLIVAFENYFKLAEPELLKDAKTGDVILFFQSTKLGIIYRQSENKIIGKAVVDLKL